MSKPEDHYHNRRLLGRRRRAITSMLIAVAECIKSDAQNEETHELLRGHWPSSFFRTATQEGVRVDVRIDFSSPADPFSSPLNSGIKCQMTLEPGVFDGCEDIPEEAKIILDIPDMEGDL